jgi:hypothetical protein
MRSRVLGAATFFLSLQLAAASAPAQAPQPPTPPKARPPFSGVAHNVITWFHRVTGTGAHRHRIVSSPPLPRPRPAQLTKTPAELPAAALEQNKTPAVEPNEAQPAAAAAEANKMSPAPASSVEPDKAPAVELNEAQPAAVEPNKVSAAPDTTVDPDKPPTVELNEVQLQPPPLSRIRCLRHPPLQLSQARRRPSFLPRRLSRMRPHRAPRQELCFEGQISQTDEATSRRQWGLRNNKRGDPGRPFGIYSFCLCDGSQIPKRSACISYHNAFPVTVPVLPIYPQAGNGGKFRFLLQSIRIVGAGRRNGLRRRTEKHKHEHPAQPRSRPRPLLARTARDARCQRNCETMTTT